MSSDLLRKLSVSAGSFETIASVFERYGIVVIRDLVDTAEVARFRAAFLAMINRFMRLEGRASEDNDDLDAAYAQFCREAPEAALAMRGLGKDLPEYHRMLVNPRLRSVLLALFGHDHQQINFDQCLFRIDRPGDAQYAFAWHQDYPYNLMSMNAVTVWMPLAPVTAEMGPMRVVPGSHRALLPVTIDRSFENVGFAKHNTIRLANLDRLTPGFESDGVDIVGMQAGDVAFFHCLLIHRSGANRSDRCRWVFNPRYGDLLDPAVVRRSWVSARQKSPFVIGEFHPDAVVAT